MPLILALQGPPSAPPTGGGIGQLLPMFAIMFLIMYFMIIRPQRRKEKERLEMLSRIRKNDRVLTTGGIFGVVMNVKDDEVMLRIDDTNNVRVRLARGNVVGIVDKGKEEGGKE